MKYYETLFVVHPALQLGRLKDMILSVKDMISQRDSKIVGIDVWGKKKLAYLIEKQHYGTYVLIQFESNGLSIDKIAVELKHNPDVLTHLTTKIEEHQVDKDAKSLDEQISNSTQTTNSGIESVPAAEMAPSDKEGSDDTPSDKEDSDDTPSDKEGSDDTPSDKEGSDDTPSEILEENKEKSEDK